MMGTLPGFVKFRYEITENIIFGKLNFDPSTITDLSCEIKIAFPDAVICGLCSLAAFLVRILTDNVSIIYDFIIEESLIMFCF